MCHERQKLEQKINSLEPKIQKFPEGKLICAKNGEHSKWYLSDGHDSVYLPKNQRKKAEILAYKKYLELLLEDLRNEKDAVESYMRHHRSSKVKQMLVDEPEYKKLLTSIFQSNFPNQFNSNADIQFQTEALAKMQQESMEKSKELEQWMNSPYETCKKYPEQRIHKTASGRMVCSKSEVMIDMALYHNGIPFRYEEEIQLGNVLICPDFTVRHPKTGKVFYWEHFGRMDDEKYVRTTAVKLRTYLEAGIIPTINLITTYETKEQPLEFDAVERIVQETFLNNTEVGL